MKKVDENIIYNNLIRSFSIYFLSGNVKKFIMNYNLFELFKSKVEDYIPFEPEMKKEILTKQKIYGYYAKIPIIVDKNLLDNFLIITFFKKKKVILDLEMFHIDKHFNPGIFLLQDLIEHIRNFSNLELGMAKNITKESVTYDLLYSKEDLLIGELKLFIEDIKDFFIHDSERLVYNYKHLKKEKFLKEIELHKDHLYKVFVNPSSEDDTVGLSCFTCKKCFSTAEIRNNKGLSALHKQILGI